MERISLCKQRAPLPPEEPHHTVPEGRLTIAHRFNGGKRVGPYLLPSPGGTTETPSQTAFQPSLPGLDGERRARFPTTEVLGWRTRRRLCRMSLQDKNNVYVPQIGGLRPTEFHPLPLAKAFCCSAYISCNSCIFYLTSPPRARYKPLSSMIRTILSAQKPQLNHEWTPMNAKKSRVAPLDRLHPTGETRPRAKTQLLVCIRVN